MRKLLLILLFPIFLQVGLSQEVTLSIAEKISNKTPDFKILGKNTEGVIIYKYGRNNREVEVYDGQLRLRWEKDLNIKAPNPSVRKIVVYPEQTLLFFVSEDKNSSKLLAQKLNAKFQGNDRFVTIDTLLEEKYDISSLVRIAPSQNQAQIIAYYPIYGNQDVESLKLIGLNKDLEVLYKKVIRFNNEEGSLQPRKVFPDNDGNVYILLEDENRKKRHFSSDDFVILRYDVESRETQAIDFDFQDPVFKKMFLEVDNVNHNLVATGFYTDQVGEEALGFFYSVYDLEEEALKVNNYKKFSSDMIFDITGKDTTKKVSGFYSFEVNDVIMRYDGGSLVIAESNFDTEESMQVPTFTPSVGPSFRTINVSYYNDIMIISLSPDGRIDWETVLKKKQVSEDDDGFFSSYAMLVAGSRLRFIYNEEIYHKTNVNEYAVDKYGKFNRDYLFNAGDKNVMLVPKLGKQISSYEIVIPSLRRNYLSFLKLSY